ncbi:Lipopolysaccharide choline phosphotransferase protein [Paragonimus kellicotti]|nr:Lipopolysaccharide choline phosphotransferase protein [Paragonimus kellicotti]
MTILVYLLLATTKFPKRTLPSANITRIKFVRKHQLKVGLFKVGPIIRQTTKVLLPKLTKLAWPQNTFAASPTGQLSGNKTTISLPEPFEPIMSSGQRALLGKLLRVASELMFDHGLGDRFMLNAESLLGSFRHHDLVPWHDRAGYLVDVTVRTQLRKRLSELRPDYLIYLTPTRDILYGRIIDSNEDSLDLELSRKVPSKEYGWPYIYFDYYEMNGTHIINLKQAIPPKYAWPYQVIFPLYFRPFGEDWFPAPRNPREFLRLKYESIDICETQSVSHVVERLVPIEMTRCQELASRYAFVRHGTCGFENEAASSDEMVLGEESLITITSMGYPSVIHSICLAVPHD